MGCMGCIGCWTGGATCEGICAGMAYGLAGMARLDASGGGYMVMAGSSILP